MTSSLEPTTITVPASVATLLATRCDECGHPQGRHVSAHDSGQWDRVTCWAESICIACLVLVETETELRAAWGDR